MTAQPTDPVSDQQLCTAIASGGAARKDAIECIYNWQDMKAKVISYVRQHGGSREDGMDIFHNGIIALDANIRSGAFRGESSLRGYLYTICRYGWNNEWRKRHKSVLHDPEHMPPLPDGQTPESIFRSEEETLLLRQVLQLLDESCRKILTLWKLSYTMAEIANDMSLSSPEMAKKYRYRCMQKLMAALDQRPQLLNALKNV